MAAFFPRMINYITQERKRLKTTLLNKISYESNRFNDRGLYNHKR